jgi:iron complex outermembrane recepter protein
MQIFVSRDGFSFYENASRARSRGLELSVESRPMVGLTLAGWVAWNDAELTDPFPLGTAAFGFPGDRLPFSSRFSGNLSLDQEFPLLESATGFVGGSVSYVGDRAGGFKAGAQSPQPIYPSYVQADLRAGLRKGPWTLNAFVNNVTDKRGLSAGDPEISTIFYYIQPRTIGVSLARSF